MKTLKGPALSMIGLVVAIAAVGCGDTIQGCQTTAGFLQRLSSCVRWLLAPKRKNAVNASAGKSSALLTTPTSGGMLDEVPNVR